MALKKKAARIELLVLDVDGVLTDGRLYFTEQGEELKAFDTQDGHGIKMWRQSGGRVAIITGRQSQLVLHRARNLGIDTVMQSREDKGIALQELAQTYELTLDAVAYVGDDLPDLAAMRLAGLGVAVANAHSWVREHADMVTTLRGGRGAVREVCDFLLDAQGKLDTLQAHYLEP
ncbi:MAG: 3-deoxy-manno-octulosonate-8-phosphatase KdsC [Pseudomonadales bacterium]|nr:3-deoxy-manno-octulosonate-8-phosphatase KdsC [Pseudomonadales bacterium]